MIVSFLSPLQVEDQQPENNWKLLSDFNVLVTEDDGSTKTFTVPAGFVTNFASVPRLPIIYDTFGDIAHKAATIHDYLYTTATEPREWCDQVFRAAAWATQVPINKAELMYLAVRKFGEAHYGIRTA